MQRLYQPPNPLVMTIAEQRNQVSELLAQVDDEFFSTVYTMLETYVRKQQPESKEEAIVGYEIDGTPITASRFVEEAEAAVEAAKAGHSITVQELEKRSEEWLSRLQ